ncbi:MAG: yycN [Acidimicrobiaceae bacterium]|nr:yycN [Acidimicrobiaceae bacterium]
MPSPPTEPERSGERLVFAESAPGEAEEIVDATLVEYVAERVAAGEAPEVAERIARRQHAAMLAGGALGPEHLVGRLAIGDEPVGVLWLATRRDLGPGVWWVYFVEIDEGRRGRGLGRAAMALAEALVLGNDGTELRLNVFANNTVARALYDSVGYRPVDPLDPGVLGKFL